MKILQVIPYLHIGWAGGLPVRIIYELSKALVQEGHEVTIYTTNALNKKNKSEGHINSFYSDDGVDIHEFKSIGDTLGTRHHIVISPAMVQKVAKEIHKFDIVHLHEFYTFQNIIIHHYAKKKQIPYVIHAHGSLPIWGAKQNMKKLYNILWGYKLLKDATKVIAITPKEAQQYKDMGVNENKIEIVPNAIDLDEFKNLPESGEFRKKYNLRADQSIILFLGRIHKIKGLDLLVKAFAELSKNIGEVKLVVVGPDDGYLPALKKLVNEMKVDERVLFTGPLYGEDKLKAYVDADVYVLPSVYEIFSVTTLEACACGTPVVVTDRCGIANFTSKSGYVVGYDKDQLRDAIFKVLINEDLKKKFGLNARKLVEQEFNWCKVIKKIEKVYERCM